jgi:hypothetical protein
VQENGQLTIPFLQSGCTGLLLSTKICQDFGESSCHVLPRVGLWEFDKVKKERERLSLSFQMDSERNVGTVVGQHPHVGGEAQGTAMLLR